MEKTRTFKELLVWQKSMKFAVLVYKITNQFPRGELYGLTSQVRRAAVAIPSNIAEGYASRHTKEYAQFVNIAFASGAELETHLELAKEFGYLAKNEHEIVSDLLNEIMKMLNKLSQVLRSRS